MQNDIKGVKFPASAPEILATGTRGEPYQYRGPRGASTSIGIATTTAPKARVF